MHGLKMVIVPSETETRVWGRNESRTVKVRATLPAQADAREGAAREGAEAAVKLAEQARAAAVSRALTPLLAADILERSYNSRLRTVEIEQTLAELQIALALASAAR